MNGLKDKHRKGITPIYTAYDKARVIQLACSKPKNGYSNWSQKRIGEKFGLSQSTVSRILKNAISMTK